MKKVYLILAFMACCFATRAQSSGFGIRLGPNLADIVDIDENAKQRLGFHAGVFYNLRLTEKFWLRPEAEYALQGAKDEIETLDANFDPVNLELTADYRYVNFRLMVGFQLLDKLSVQVGPQFGLLTLAQLKTDNAKEDLTDDLTSTDVGMAMGVGYRFMEFFELNLRYNLGFTDIVDESARNSVFQLGLSMRLTH